MLIFIIFLSTFPFFFNIGDFKKKLENILFQKDNKETCTAKKDAWIKLFRIGKYIKPLVLNNSL